MADRNRRPMWTGTLLAALLVAGGGSVLADGEALAATAPASRTATTVATAPTSQPAKASSDWPQWRGPNRDGIAAPGPKLADAWPEGGPKLLWKSGPIANGWETKGCVGLGGQLGGLGSVTVVGERAFVYVHWKRKGGTVAITTKDMNELGWKEGVPDDLAKRIEDEIQKARADDPRDKRWKVRLDEAKREAFLKDFPATLDPKLVEKHGTWIKDRSTQIWTTHPIEVKSWTDLAKMAEIRDKEFPTYNDLMAELKKRGIGDGFFYGLQPLADHLQTMGNAYTDTVICLDASTGKELWKREFPGAASKEMCYIGASGTPAVWGDNCYASGSAGLYCLSVKDGSVVWQAKTTFTHSSPLVANGGVFLMLKEGLTAFDAKTGEVLWAQPKIQNRQSSVVPWASGGKSYLIAMAGKGAFCVDPANGDVVWQGAAPGGEFSATPVIRGNTMVTTPLGAMVAMTMTPDKGELLWQRQPGANDGSTPIIYQDCVYQTACRYTGWASRCRDLKTGKLLWEFQSHGECTSAIAADGKIIAVHDGGDGKFRLIMFRATPEKFELLGLGSTRELMPYGSTPSIANGRLYARLADCVACYDITAEGNPGATPPKPAVVVDQKHDIYGNIEAVSTVDKGDSLEITDPAGKVTTLKKSDITDVIKPGMRWQLGR